ncbi:MAG: Twitching mobility protein [Syntrophaceae bacterium PtaU1.Bin231]|nr:PilT/PilU family type 4a pilus ATPase [Phycisphaerae bacterium]OPY87187.1 MAG: Twitching mobility protein [Syntrophaceae bacterium PtaU1.Bin231]
MGAGFSVDAKIYPAGEGVKLSMTDMLAYFQRQGAMRVSDLHIKIGTVPAYRIDGDLVKLKGAVITEELARPLIYSLLSDNDIALLERDYTVDCSYQFGDLHFRMNAFRDYEGLAIAIRALGADIPKPQDIGFPNDVWRDICRRTHGLVLLTGITGAGKSTTIASILEKINADRACRIITIEDPVEYMFSQKNCLISQREIGRDVRSFESGLRSMMREDPDVIFVGEMRDSETVSLTLTAAETGHLVFSTLHTRDVTGSITRILDFFPAGRQDEVRNQLSLGLAYVISQKLIPRKGGNGRMVVMEILNNNYAVANLIRKGKVEQIYSIMQTKTKNQQTEKMITFERHLAQLVKRHEIDLLEAQKWANDINSFEDAMKSDADIE